MNQDIIKIWLRLPLDILNIGDKAQGTVFVDVGKIMLLNYIQLVNNLDTQMKFYRQLFTPH